MMVVFEFFEYNIVEFDLGELLYVCDLSILEGVELLVFGELLVIVWIKCGIKVFDVEEVEGVEVVEGELLVELEVIGCGKLEDEVDG